MRVLEAEKEKMVLDFVCRRRIRFGESLSYDWSFITTDVIVGVNGSAVYVLREVLEM